MEFPKKKKTELYGLEIPLEYLSKETENTNLKDLCTPGSLQLITRAKKTNLYPPK